MSVVSVRLDADVCLVSQSCVCIYIMSEDKNAQAVFICLKTCIKTVPVYSKGKELRCKYEFIRCLWDTKEFVNSCLFLMYV